MTVLNDGWINGKTIIYILSIASDDDFANIKPSFFGAILRSATKRKAK
jgi:hypothetical protein